MVSELHASLYTVLLAVGVYWLKVYMNGCVCLSDVRLDGKVAIVTGANSAIGRETALDLAERGAVVYLACRSVEKAQRAVEDIVDETGISRDRLVVLRLDLASLQSVREFAKEFKAREDRLHILVNNAGVLWTEERHTSDGLEMNFGTNHLGHFLLTNLLLDLLVAAAPSRIVTVSGNLYELHGPMNFEDIVEGKMGSRLETYEQSKLANIMFSNELSERLAGTGVTTYSLHPGVFTSEIFSLIPYSSLLRPVLYTLAWPFTKTLKQGAQTQIFCAVDESVGQESGKYYSDCAVAEPADYATRRDDNIRLWEISAHLVNLTQQETSRWLKPSRDKPVT